MKKKDNPLEKQPETKKRDFSKETTQMVSNL